MHIIKKLRHVIERTHINITLYKKLNNLIVSRFEKIKIVYTLML